MYDTIVNMMYLIYERTTLPECDSVDWTAYVGRSLTLYTILQCIEFTIALVCHSVVN